MNKIVREHYPVAKLPEDLRGDLDLGSRARVVVEGIGETRRRADRPREGGTEVELPITRLLEEMQEQRVFDGDPVARVRALRAEWDWREEHHERIRRGDAD